MPGATITLEIPPEPDLAWALANAAAIAKILKAAQLNQRMKIYLIPAGSAQFNSEDPIQRGEQFFALNLPVFYRNGVPANIPNPSTATAEDCANKINELLVQERTVQVLPTSAE